MDSDDYDELRQLERMERDHGRFAYLSDDESKAVRWALDRIDALETEAARLHELLAAAQIEVKRLSSAITALEDAPEAEKRR